MTKLENVVKSLVTMRSQVVYLLKRYPLTRDNDFYLELLWMKTFGGLNDYIKYIPADKIKTIGGKLGTASRIRRKIQNEFGLFPPTNPEVRHKRMEMSDVMRLAINNPRVNKLTLQEQNLLTLERWVTDW
jgi:hypothetical protein